MLKTSIDNGYNPYRAFFGGFFYTLTTSALTQNPKLTSIGYPKCAAGSDSAYSKALRALSENPTHEEADRQEAILLATQAAEDAKFDKADRLHKSGQICGAAFFLASLMTAGALGVFGYGGLGGVICAVLFVTMVVACQWLDKHAKNDFAS